MPTGSPPATKRRRLGDSRKQQQFHSQHPLLPHSAPNPPGLLDQSDDRNTSRQLPPVENSTVRSQLNSAKKQAVAIGLRKSSPNRNLGLQLTRDLWFRSFGLATRNSVEEIFSNNHEVIHSQNPQELSTSVQTTTFLVSSSSAGTENFGQESQSLGVASEIGAALRVRRDSSELFLESEGEDEIRKEDPDKTSENIAGDITKYAADSTAFENRPSQTVFSSSQHDLIQYLHSLNWPASTMRSFLNDRGMTLNEELLELHELDKLETLLDIYVVSPCDRSVQGPSDIAHRADFYNDIDLTDDHSIFLFLNKLWERVQPHSAGTSFHMELDTGPWILFSKYLGPAWVAFFIGNCRVYRPFNADLNMQSAGKWLDITLGARWNLYYPKEELSAKLYPQRSTKPPRFATVSKQSIMYQRRLTRSHLDIGEKPDSARETGLYYDFLLIIVHKRLRKYMALSRKAQKRVPKSPHIGNREVNVPMWTPINTVSSFINDLLRSFLPTRLLGSKNNHIAFYKAIRKYLKTPGYTQSSVASFTKGLRINDIPWLKQLSPQIQQKALMHCITWLILHVVHPVLAHHFYITEMSGKATTIYYFEQWVWKTKFEVPGRQYLIDQLQSGSNPVTQASGTDDGEHIRYVPKPDGSIRPIINLKMFNETLQRAHQVLHDIIPSSSSRLSSWHNWAVQLYHFRNRHPNAKKFYAVKADISGCYDNANIDTVKKLVMKILEQGRSAYKIQHIRSLNVRSKSIKDKSFVKKLPEIVANDLLRAAATLPYTGISGSSGNTEIIGEFPKVQYVQGTEVLDLTDRLFNDLRLRLSKEKTIMFKQGIPQGSSISLELCNVLLDDLVHTQLRQFVEDPNSMLLRYVDDFLFVTTEKEVAQMYLSRMEAGFIEHYGVWCNPAKIVTNFESDSESSTNVSPDFSRVPSKETRYLGNDIVLDTLDLIPRDLEPLNMRLDGPADNLSAMKRKLNSDMMKFMGTLRSFQRLGMPIPLNLLHATALKFGSALAQRLPFYLLVHAELPSPPGDHDPAALPKAATALKRRLVSPCKVFYAVVNRYFAPFVEKDQRAQLIFRVIKKRYYQEGAKLVRRNIPFVELSWKKRAVQDILNMQLN